MLAVGCAVLVGCQSGTGGSEFASSSTTEPGAVSTTQPGNSSKTETGNISTAQPDEPTQEIGDATTTVVVPVSSTRVPRAKKPYDATLRATLKSVASYWNTAMPSVYGKNYKQLSGGIYAYSKDSTIPPCGGIPTPYLLLQQNAFYCPESDFIAWDDQGLFPRLNARYGPFLLSIVLAHEWGHAVQERMALTSSSDGVTLEQQADCFAGSWSANLSVASDGELALLRDRSLDRALAGFVEFRDLLGMTANDPGAHGTAFDRIRAFQDGYDNGAEACVDYPDQPPTLVAVPYRSFKERFRGGNLPYDQVIGTLSTRMDRFWREQLGAIASPMLVESGGLPVCSSPLLSPEGFGETDLSWCADDDILYYSDSDMRKVYDDVGDFGVATELALTRALAHETSTGSNIGEKNIWLRAVCTVGAWTGSMYEPDSPELSVLSPGDVDEGVRTLLEYATKGSQKQFGSGFEQVAAYREGVLGSVQDCGVPVVS